MKQKILDLIEQSESIVIMRHKHPDYDAYGAQFGLGNALKQHYPAKKIFIVGDDNDLNQFGPLDVVDEPIVRQSLLFILDTSVRQMLSEDLPIQAQATIIIDHHQNQPDLPYTLYWQDTTASSTSEMIAIFLLDSNLPLPVEAAKPLFMGIVGDTGRFLFANVSPKTFRVAAKCLETGLDLSLIYQSMYQESMAQKLAKAEYLTAIETTKHQVGYRKITKEYLKKHQLDPYSASRMMANQLSGIREIPIWANFTEADKDGVILCELRSRNIPIVDVAKQFGGGGHLLACGCRVGSWNEVEEVLLALDALLEEHNG